MKMRISKEPEVEPGVKYFDHKAADVEKCLVLSSREFLEAKVCMLEEWNPSIMEESKEEQVRAKSKL
jgi:hypothetical protein